MNKRKLCSILQSDVHPKRLQETQRRTNKFLAILVRCYVVYRTTSLDSTRNCIAISLCLCFFSS